MAGHGIAHELFHRDVPAGQPLEETFLEQLHPKLQEVFKSSPMLKNMWEQEVKSAVNGLTTDDLGKLDPDQLHHLIDAQKDVDHRMEEVNKLVEEHGDALDQLKSLMAGVTSQSLPGVLVIGPWQSLPRRLNSWRMAEFL
ncbi:unnamed protein product [Durusdinium trenchii]|uniref:Uncharacterized protein n=2 Tax=Durusdinium trenchii TaxID=1381693 RepID=A0ABP0KRS8_9DINO